MNIRSIVGGKNAMEKSRDILQDGIVKKHLIRLQDHGIRVGEDDPVEIGRKILESP